MESLQERLVALCKDDKWLENNYTVAQDAVKTRREKEDYAFRRQLNEKPSSIPGCPGLWRLQLALVADAKLTV